jgi:hypothetical protein
MKELPVEDGALGMTGLIDSCHGRREESRIGPILIGEAFMMKRYKLERPLVPITSPERQLPLTIMLRLPKATKS